MDSNLCDLVQSCAEPAARAFVALEIHKAAKVLDSEDRRNSDDVVVCGCDDAMLVVEGVHELLYDRRVKLVVSAEVPPMDLYTDGPMAHEFPRTVSRLSEMQTSEYLSLERRVVDTGLT